MTVPLLPFEVVAVAVVALLMFAGLWMVANPGDVQPVEHDEDRS